MIKFSEFNNLEKWVGFKIWNDEMEWRNLERSIFRNFKIANTKMPKDELFDSFIIEFIFLIFYKLFE